MNKGVAGGASQDQGTFVLVADEAVSRDKDFLRKVEDLTYGCDGIKLTYESDYWVWLSNAAIDAEVVLAITFWEWFEGSYNYVGPYVSSRSGLSGSWAGLRADVGDKYPILASPKIWCSYGGHLEWSADPEIVGAGPSVAQEKIAYVGWQRLIAALRFELARNEVVTWTAAMHLGRLKHMDEDLLEAHLSGMVASLSAANSEARLPPKNYMKRFKELAPEGAL